MNELDQPVDLSTKGAKQTQSGQDNYDSFFENPLATSSLTGDNFRNGSFVPNMDDLGTKDGTFHMQVRDEDNLKWKQLRNVEESNRAKSTDEGIFHPESQLLVTKPQNDNMMEFEFNTTTAAPERSETLELANPIQSPKMRRASDADVFSIKPNGTKTPKSVGSQGSIGMIRFNIAVMGDKGSGKTSLIEALVKVCT